MKTFSLWLMIKDRPYTLKAYKKIDVRYKVFVETEQPLVLIYMVGDNKSNVVYDAGIWVLCWLSRICSQREGDRECLNSFFLESSVGEESL